MRWSPAASMASTSLPGTDQSLAIYTEEAFARLADRLAQASPTRQDVRTFQPAVLCPGAAGWNWTRKDACEFRPNLAELARLEKEVVMLGVQDHVEIWAAQRWQAYLAERQGHYDEIAEAAFR